MTDALVAEIERLKSELRQQQQDNSRWLSARDVWQAEMTALRSRCERLEAALRRIAAGGLLQPEMKEIATAALRAADGQQCPCGLPPGAICKKIDCKMLVEATRPAQSAAHDVGKGEQP